MQRHRHLQWARDQQQQGIGAVPCSQRQLPEAALAGWVVGGTARELRGPATPLRWGPHPAMEAADQQGFMQGRKWRCQPQPLLAALLQQQLLLSPLQQVVAHNCHLDRPTDVTLRQAAAAASAAEHAGSSEAAAALPLLFSKVEALERYRVGAMWPVSEQAWGVLVR